MISSGVGYFVFAAMYAIGAWAGHTFATQPDHIVLFWLPSGLMLGALLLAPYKKWWIYLSAALTTTVLLNTVWRLQPVTAAVLLGAATAVEATVGAFVLRRLLGSEPRFLRVREVVGFMVVSLLVAAPVGALIGAWASAHYLEGPFWRELRHWWLGDALGIVMVTPAIISIAPSRYPSPHVWRPETRVAELIAACGIIGLSAWFVYRTLPSSGIPAAVLLPLFIWTAARFGAPGMSLALFIVTLVASYGTIGGFGPAASMTVSQARSLSLQAVMISFGVTGWVLVTLWQELRAAAHDLRLANTDLEQSVAERTASLRASEERFRQVFMHAATGIVIADVMGRVAECNPAMSAILGYDPHELRGMHLRDLLDDEHRADLGMTADETDDGWAQRISGEHRYQHLTGRGVWVHTVVSQLRDDAGNPTNVVALLTDITDRKRVEEDLRRSDRQKDEFLATLAHELRNPLAPIRSAAGALRAPDPGRSLIDRCHNVIERHVALMARLLDDLLDVSRLSRGRLIVQRRPLLLAEAIEAAVETSRPIIDSKHQQLTIEWLVRDVMVEGDVARLTQVFSNLLNNAAKYSPDGASLQLVVGRNAPHAVVTVRDAGIGIEPDVIDRVFDLFVQARPGYDAASGGLGIGLSLARRLVELQGGTIRAASAGRGQGSEFTVSLPLSAVSLPVDVPAPPLVPRASSERRRILIADDNVDAADTLALLLQGSGRDVRVVYDGEAAIREAEHFRPDLMLLDIGMPGVSGHETCRRIRRQPWGASVVIAAVSGWGQSGDREQSAAAGFDAHLVKPVDPDALLSLLNDGVPPLRHPDAPTRDAPVA